MGSQARVYDNGGKTIDRYTLVVPNPDYPRTVDMYGFNENPFSPQGFGQYAGDYPMMSSYSHLGKLVDIESLPSSAKQYVKQTLKEYTDAGAKVSIRKVSYKTSSRKYKKSRKSDPGLGTMR